MLHRRWPSRPGGAHRLSGPIAWCVLVERRTPGRGPPAARPIGCSCLTFRFVDDGVHLAKLLTHVAEECVPHSSIRRTRSRVRTPCCATPAILCEHAAWQLLGNHRTTGRIASRIMSFACQRSVRFAKITLCAEAQVPPVRKTWYYLRRRRVWSGDPRRPAEVYVKVYVRPLLSPANVSIGVSLRWAKNSQNNAEMRFVAQASRVGAAMGLKRSDTAQRLAVG